MQVQLQAKTKQMIDFLLAVGELRTRRITSLDSWEVVWLHTLPSVAIEVASPFFGEEHHAAHPWLRIRKPTEPILSQPPEYLHRWFRAPGIDDAYTEPRLSERITVLVDKDVPNPDALPGEPTTIRQRVPEDLFLSDHPEILEQWRTYVDNEWQPWADRWKVWEKVQNAYEALDRMRRRIEEAGERYELRFALGLLQWRDDTSARVFRHVVTAGAEFAFDAARGQIDVQPATDFQRARIELDMLDPMNRPSGLEASLADALEELDVELWSNSRVAPLLAAIGNRIRPDTRVRSEALEPDDRTDSTPIISLAPAVLLRERRPTAFQEVLQHLREAQSVPDGGTSEWPASGPWHTLMAEGEDSPSGPPVGSAAVGGCTSSTSRVYFPLATNEEQRRIVEQHSRFAGVLVQGPPGTGKSHTIANLISHLLARGERVLVTAHGPRALEVLRHKLPPEIRQLCVSALGSSRDEQKELEASIARILHRRTTWSGSAKDHDRCNELESKLTSTLAELAGAERELREQRESETFEHHLAGGYKGTAASIARQLHDRRSRDGWLEGCVSARCEFPLSPADVQQLRSLSADASPDARSELRKWIGPDDLPTADEVSHWILQESRISRRLAELQATLDAGTADLDRLHTLSASQLRSLNELLGRLDDAAQVASTILNDDGGEVINAALGPSGETGALVHASSAEFSAVQDLSERLRDHNVRVPADLPPDRTEIDALRRAAHFSEGRSRGLPLVRPRAVRQTQYIEDLCLVDGAQPREAAQLRLVAAFLESRRRGESLWSQWARYIATDPGSFELRLATLSALFGSLAGLTDLRGLLADQISLNTSGWASPSTLAEPHSRALLRRTVEAALVAAELAELRQCFERTADALSRAPRQAEAHPVILDLRSAVESRDHHAYMAALSRCEELRSRLHRLTAYDQMLERVAAIAPQVVALLRDKESAPDAPAHLSTLEEAWHWASARAWLQNVQSDGRYHELTLRIDRLAERVQDLTSHLASTLAWSAFLERLDEPTRQNLVAWQQAIEKIGKGTGKRAVRFRSEARKYLRRCLDAIPAWVMPLYKVWESVDAQPGLFDTIIVDEASQCGVDSLVLLYLAKKIIVVGDKMQVSPMMVGVEEDDLARLSRVHLKGFRFQAMFRPDQSLYHHAERTFGNIVALREHFRCVPEIIRFSNKLCYRDSPLIPLRQYPPDRLPPVRTTFVAEGHREGRGAHVINRVEADRLVDAVEACLFDDRYDGRTFGVITLQGHAQAELIGSLLAKRVPAAILAERRVLCGDPSTFQGDERHVVFLSMVAAPNAPFSALTTLPFQQRYNVAMSRAADQVWIFHSVRLEDLSPTCYRYELLTFALAPETAEIETIDVEQEALERLARGRRQPGTQPPPFDSWFEVDVALELLRKRYRVTPQFEVAGKRIDLVVEGRESRLAVECDGDAWHGAERFDEDMARQRRLERAGWRFVRVRESQFYADRSESIAEVVDACDELSIVPVDSPLHRGPTEGEKAHLGSRPSLPEGSTPLEPIADTRAATVDGGDHDARSEQDEADVADLDELPGAADPSAPFCGYENLRFPDPRRATRESVREALFQIAERDAPLPRSAMHRLYVEGCPDVQRVGRTIRQSLDAVIGGMLRSGMLEQESELGPRTAEYLILRLPGRPRVRPRPAGNRQLEEIPPSEIQQVMLHLHSEPTTPRGVQADALFRAVLDHYGMKRLTTQRRSYLQQLLTYVYPLAVPPDAP